MNVWLCFECDSNLKCYTNTHTREQLIFRSVTIYIGKTYTNIARSTMNAIIKTNDQHRRGIGDCVITGFQHDRIHAGQNSFHKVK